MSLANTMNWNMTMADFEFNRRLEPNGCFILEANSKPIGLATCIGYGQVGWFGNLVVDETTRKLGAGTQLVQHAVTYLKSRGITTVGLYAYQHLEEFYGRIGFEGDADFVVLKAEAVSAKENRERNMRLAEVKDLSFVADFDGDCFGGVRKRLLASILKNPENIGYVEVKDSRPEGFVAAKVYGDSVEIGPLVCKRSKLKTAENLLVTVLQRLDGFEAYMYLPASETSLIDIARKRGFTEEFRLRRMILGPEVAKNCIYSAESLERG